MLLAKGAFCLFSFSVVEFSTSVVCVSYSFMTGLHSSLIDQHVLFTRASKWLVVGSNLLVRLSNLLTHCVADLAAFFYGLLFIQVDCLFDLSF